MSSPGLKRPLELDQHMNTHLMGLKRRCGSAAAVATTTMHQHQLQQQQQQQQQQQHLAQQQNLTQHHHNHQHHNLTSSPFKSTILAPVGDEVARVIKDEIINNQSQQHHHHQQQQQQHHQHQHNRDQQQPHLSLNQQQHQNTHGGPSHSQQQLDPPVLTIRQTQIICEKLIKDREQKLREEYDRILMSKLAEQYETFVKYAHDHLEKTNSQHQASYLS